MRIYISGPMTGIENNNFDSFYRAECQLKGEGHTVLNPASNPLGLEYNHYMDISMAMIRSSEAVYCLPGFNKSKGAMAEVAYAVSLGLEILGEK
jgi:hypothetical protein